MMPDLPSTRKIEARRPSCDGIITDVYWHRDDDGQGEVYNQLVIKIEGVSDGVAGEFYRAARDYFRGRRWVVRLDET